MSRLQRGVKSCTLRYGVRLGDVQQLAEHEAAMPLSRRQQVPLVWRAWDQGLRKMAAVVQEISCGYGQAARWIDNPPH